MYNLLNKYYLREMFIALKEKMANGHTNFSSFISTCFGLLKLQEILPVKINATTIRSALPPVARYFNAPAQAGYSPAQFLRGICLLNNRNTTTAEQRLGFSLLLATADRNYPLSLNSVGRLFATGNTELNLLADPKQAFAYFSRAAELSDARGHRNLGLCLIHGFGAEKNINLGLRHLCLAFKLGDPLAKQEIAGYRNQLLITKEREKLADLSTSQQNILYLQQSSLTRIKPLIADTKKPACTYSICT